MCQQYFFQFCIGFKVSVKSFPHCFACEANRRHIPTTQRDPVEGRAEKADARNTVLVVGWATFYGLRTSRIAKQIKQVLSSMLLQNLDNPPRHYLRENQIKRSSPPPPPSLSNPDNWRKRAQHSTAYANEGGVRKFIIAIISQRQHR